MSKLLNDPIHSHIMVPAYCVEIMDTPQFQRLRYLKQLGVTSFVFPGANHTRFEHSIGVSFLANKQMTHLQQQQPELDIGAREVRLVTVAGLCHDLGHGPFSHCFEGWVHRQQRASGIGEGELFHHEAMSEKLLDLLVDDNGLAYERDELRVIKEMIRGKKNGNYLYQIVANKRNAIDVDKFDYLERDAYYCGMPKHNFDRLILRSRVVENDICYHVNEAYNLGQLFHTRYSMFKQVYTHQVGISIEMMIFDILSLANETLNIMDRLNPEEYTFLNDSIINRIEESRDPGLKDAQALLLRLRRRQLYKNVGAFSISEERVKDQAEVERRFLHYCPEGVTEQDFAIYRIKMDYGMKSEDPLANVRYFSSRSTTEQLTVKGQAISAMYPTVFLETLYACICKTKSKEREIAQAWDAFQNAMRREFNAVNQASPHTKSYYGLMTPQSEMKKEQPAEPQSTVPLKKLRLDEDFE